jgi:citrate lyase subunit beta/citryl-CoA lyase
MRSILLHSTLAPEIWTQALSSGASALLLRLEGIDEARVSARNLARELIADSRAAPERPRLFVQIAPVAACAIDADLGAVVAPGLDGVFLEGCEGRAHVQALSAKLSVREAEAGLPAGAVRIVALAAQTPGGTFALGTYRDASQRLIGLALDDAPLPGGGFGTDIARAHLLLGAASAGVGAFVLAPDVEGAALESACAVARRDGFAGMLARSPSQIGPIERAFGAP